MASNPISASTPASPISQLLAPLLAQPSDKLTSKQVGAQKDLVRQHIQTTQNNLHRLITEKHDHVTSLLNGSIEARSKSSVLRTKLEKLEQDVDGDEPTSLIPPLLDTLKTHAHVRHDLSHAKHRLRFFRLLLTYQKMFSQIVSNPPLPLPRSVQIWSECHDLLQQEEWDWADAQGKKRMHVLKADLEERLRVVKDRVGEQLSKIFEGAASLDWDSKRATGVVSIQEPAQISFQELVASLKTLGTLQTHVNTLLNRLVHQIFLPIISSPAFVSPSSSVKPKQNAFSQTHSSSDSKLSIFRFTLGNESTGSPAHSSNWTHCLSIQPILQALLVFLSTSLPSVPNAKSPIEQTLQELITPLLFPLIKKHHLEPSLRFVESPAELPTFIATCAELVQWETDQTGGSSREISEFEKEVGLSWAKVKRASILESARNQLVGKNPGGRDPWAFWVWEKEVWVDELKEEVGQQDPALEERKVALEESGSESSSRPPALDSISVQDVRPIETIEGDDGWGFEEDEPSVPPIVSLATPPVVLSPEASDLESSGLFEDSPVEIKEEEEDGWGFETTPPPQPAVALPPVLPLKEEEEEDAWGFGSDSEGQTSVPVIAKPAAAVPKQARRLEKAQAKLLREDSLGEETRSLSTSSSLSLRREGSMGRASRSETKSPTVDEEPSSFAPKPRGGGMKLGRKTSSTVDSPIRQVSDASLSPSVTIEETPTALPPPPLIRPSGPRLITERLRVSERLKDVLGMVEKVVKITEDLSALESTPIAVSSSDVLTRTIPDILALYRATVPVIHAPLLESTPALMMQFVNDCEYLAFRLERIPFDPPNLKKDQIVDTLNKARARFYDLEIERQQTSINTILDGADQLVQVANEKRTEQCEAAVQKTIEKMHQLEQAWKSVLPTHRALHALGLIVDQALTRILGEIMSLGDITTNESEELNRLCKALHPLEGMFVQEPGASSAVVAYVPTWLKFCYLSELLEASLVDITYLFENGALIDFEPDELAGLIKSLFSDTSLRAKTVDLIWKGHPGLRNGETVGLEG